MKAYKVFDNEVGVIHEVDYKPNKKDEESRIIVRPTYNIFLDKDDAERWVNSNIERRIEWWAEELREAESKLAHFKSMRGNIIYDKSAKSTQITFAGDYQ